MQRSESENQVVICYLDLYNTAIIVEFYLQVSIQNLI